MSNSFAALDELLRPNGVTLGVVATGFLSAQSRNGFMSGGRAHEASEIQPGQSTLNPISVLHAPSLALRRLVGAAASLSIRAPSPSGTQPASQPAAVPAMTAQPALYGNGPNVLVYAGPGTSKTAVAHTLHSLRSLLRTSHDVIPVDAKVLANEPWQDSTSLLVIPGGRDLPYVKELGGPTSALIKDYVARGGRFLGICAGAYFASDRIEFEVGRKDYEIIGERELKFYPGPAVGSAYPGFVYDAEQGARAIDILASLPGPIDPSSGLAVASTQTLKISTYHNGGCTFLPPISPSHNFTILARYADTVTLYNGTTLDSPPAIILTAPGQGRALVSGVHIEYDAGLVARDSNKPDGKKLANIAADLEKTEKERIELFSAYLKALGVKFGDAEDVVKEEDGLAPMPTPMHLTFSTHESATFLPKLFEKTMDRDGAKALEDSAFTLRLIPSTNPSAPQLLSQLAQSDLETAREAMASEKPGKPAVNVLVYPSGIYPAPSETPHFDMSLFHAKLGELVTDTENPVLGAIAGYSHVIPSTQTLLDKNFKLSSVLPDGFLALATHQTAGRGRGRNAWISPLGCLQFSLLLRHPRHSPVVFLQYLFSLAVVEAVKSCEGCAGLPVFIKWPNDVYAKLPAADGQTELKKLGGLLVNSTFSGNEFLLVFGQGLNVANARPSSCLNAVLDAVYPNGLPKGVSYFRQETLLATILARFRDLYYNHYLPRGFRAVEGRYLSHWLHSDQQVGVENEGQVKIRGINEDGELVVEKLEGGGRLCLGPDGNGFDMMRNLLVQKHQS